MHVSDDDEHYEALRYVEALIRSLDLTSVLDVGAGTGRALEYLRRSSPELKLKGVEPVRELIAQALERPTLRPEDFVMASGQDLPFADNSFDAVTEFAVLHHVPSPAAVVSEMTRVARRAVFLSDTNRFGYGSYLSRVAKLGLYRAKLWTLADFLRNRGRRYRFTEDDGIFYSYSVFDSYQQLADWGDRVLLVPTRASTNRSWAHPLLTTTHVLLAAVRDAHSH